MHKPRLRSALHSIRSYWRSSESLAFRPIPLRRVRGTTKRRGLDWTKPSVGSKDWRALPIEVAQRLLRADSVGTCRHGCLIAILPTSGCGSGPQRCPACSPCYGDVLGASRELELEGG